MHLAQGTIERVPDGVRIFVDIGTELFAQTASAARAQALIERGRDHKEVLALVDHFCAESRIRIDRAFHGIGANNDRMGYRLAQDVLEGGTDWLFDGIVGTGAQTPAAEDEPDLVLEPNLEEIRT